MEYFPLGDLSHHIEALTSPIVELDAVQIVTQILEGVDFMHNLNYAHRDLKPAVRDFQLANNF
jgi:serine/threonine protein kinase